MKSLSNPLKDIITVAAAVLILPETSSAFPFSTSSVSRLSILRRADPNWPIKSGYVSFGDSFGAGMGTGSTSWGKCRVGSNNFGELLNKWTNNPNVEFQKLVCSGDTTVGLNRQIDEWTNPGRADIATVSIGGNDLDFSNLVWYCLLTPNDLGQWYNRPRCTQREQSAYDKLADQSENGMLYKLKSAYKKIMTKSGRDVSSLIFNAFISTP
jgi:hypothetical protein